MTITAKVIEDSISKQDIRLTTMQLTYPRFIHSEVMTHRVFSRNASSSRAIPVAKMIEMVRTDPAMPIHWGKNQPGMQAHEELTGLELDHAKQLWKIAADEAADTAKYMVNLGVHKQVANRILEPFQHIHVVVTATEWENFFNLRNHQDAQPEIRALAIVMREAMDASKPKVLLDGEWHLPYVLEEEYSNTLANLRKMSAARCARVSYLTHDGKTPDIDKDLELYSRLIDSEPMHASPIEHQATPDKFVASIMCGGVMWNSAKLHGNFYGWIQNRKLVESIQELTLDKE